MKKFHVLAFVAFAALALLLAGCTEGQTGGVQITTLSAPSIPSDASVTNAGSCGGNKIRVILISPNPNSLYPEAKVRSALEKTVNSGEYNILAIRTIYDQGVLERAEIYFCSP